MSTPSLRLRVAPQLPINVTADAGLGASISRNTLSIANNWGAIGLTSPPSLSNYSSLLLNNLTGEYERVPTVAFTATPTAALPIAGGTMTGAINEAPTATLASASTIDIGAAAANTILVTGTTPITALGTIAAGAIRRLVFDNVLTLTHNAVSLILPGSASIVTAQGDAATFLSLGSGNWRCIGYQPAAGLAAALAATPAFDTIAALQAATISASTNVVTVNGYYAAGDGGGGLYKRVADTGGLLAWQFRSNGATVRWELVADRIINLRQFGAKGDLSQNDRPAIQAAIDFAQGRTIYVPTGFYRMDSGCNSSAPVNFIGDGKGAGPGLMNSSGFSEFRANFTNPVLFDISSIYPSTFRNLSFSIAAAFQSSGAGSAISITAPVGNTTNNIIDNCAFNWFHRCIYALNPAYWTITNNYFKNWKDYAIYSFCDGTREASLGFVNHNYFFGEDDTTQAGQIWLNHGYTIISENEMLGGQYGVRLSVSNHPAGFLKVVNNTIENTAYAGVFIETTDINDVSMIDISGNEFSDVTGTSNIAAIHIGDGPARVWLSDVTIRNNIIRNNTAGGGFVPIRVGAG
ncbi:MAG: glycosyl hydrolase family 28-related protein [Ralstonia sp.]